jgi:hypothetical protein
LFSRKRSDCFKQAHKKFHASIYYSHHLLSDISVQQPIVFVQFTQMVVRLVSQINLLARFSRTISRS